MLQSASFNLLVQGQTVDLSRRQQLHVAPAISQPNSAVSTPLRWTFKTHCKKRQSLMQNYGIVQELCESRGGRPGLSVLTSLLVSVDVKNY